MVALYVFGWQKPQCPCARDIWINKFPMEVNHICLQALNSIHFPFLTLLDLSDDLYYIRHGNIVLGSSSPLASLMTLARVVISFSF